MQDQDAEFAHLSKASEEWIDFYRAVRSTAVDVRQSGFTLPDETTNWVQIASLNREG